MSKLSSRLQSRVAKRGNAISAFEYERGYGKEMVRIGRGLLNIDAITEGEMEIAYRKYNEVCGMVNDLARDQQLDKELLRLAYKLENAPNSLNNTFIFGGTMVSVESLGRL